MTAMTELESYLREYDACAITPTRKLIAAYVKGQLGPLRRKSVMPIARAAGIAPRTLQELLSLHRWDEELMRTLLQRRARRLVGPAGAAAILHPTVVPKRGTKTPGVERQEVGQGGKSTNCCRILHLSLAGEGNWALIDGDLYLPRSWTEESDRLRRAGIPADTPHRSEGVMALELLDRAAANGIRPRWVLFEPALAVEPRLLPGLEERGLRYAAEMPGSFRGAMSRSLREHAGGLPFRRLFKLPSGEQDPGPCPMDVLPWDGDRLLAVLRHPWKEEFRFFVGNAPLEEGESVIEAALSRPRWTRIISRGLEEIGFDHFEVRGYRSLKRHLRLSEASLLFQSEQRARQARAARATAP